MQYKLVIQELKKSRNQNVRAFVKEVEGIKRWKIYGSYSRRTSICL